MEFFKSMAGAMVVVGLSAAALAHNHVTVDTASGQSGDQIVIRAGYLAGDSGVSIDGEGRLRFDGSIGVYRAPELISGGELSGWHGADELSLTSDYFAATGRLDGGAFKYEIVSITRVTGTSGSGPAVLAWGALHSGVIHAEARSDGATRDERSMDVGLGTHQHGQVFATDGEGVFDVTLVAWDAAGKYADSVPMTFRFTTTCAADVNVSGAVTVQDIFDFLAAWFVSGAAADYNGSGSVTVQDIFDFLSAWFAGC